MDTSALPTIPLAQSEDNSNSWSISGLKLSIEFGKDCLAGQTQRKQVTEQRALQLIPFSVGLAGVLLTLVYTGKLVPFDNNYSLLWAAATALFVGVACALATLTRPEWGYSGMEPKDTLSRYAAEGNEHGLLKEVSDEYQRRIDFNKKELTRMFRITQFANFCVLLGLIYAGATMATSQREKPSLSSNAPQHETAPQSVPPATH